MDEKELVVAFAQGATQAVIKPVYDLWNCLVLPRLEGERDAIYVEQEANLRIVTAKAQKMLAEAGITPEQPKLPLLIPILQHASLEGDETLQTKWATLLANAAKPSQSAQMRTVFPDILRQLSPEDVLFLDRLYDHVRQTTAEKYGEGGVSPNSVQKAAITISELVTIYHDIWPLPDTSPGDPDREQKLMDAQRYHISRRAVILRNCMRSGLIDRVLTTPNETATYLTALGYEFVNACRPPKESRRHERHE